VAGLIYDPRISRRNGANGRCLTFLIAWTINTRDL
jgi:hypothetical protein